MNIQVSGCEPLPQVSWQYHKVFHQQEEKRHVDELQVRLSLGRPLLVDTRHCSVDWSLLAHHMPLYSSSQICEYNLQMTQAKEDHLALVHTSESTETVNTVSIMSRIPSTQNIISNHVYTALYRCLIHNEICLRLFSTWSY